MSNLSQERFCRVRVQSIPLALPLQYDIFLHIAGEFLHFRNVGESIAPDRMESLLAHGLVDVYIPVEQKHLYNASLRDLSRDDSLKPEVRGKLLKEFAFNHVSDLFARTDVRDLAGETVELVEDMVNFISADLSAATTLMKLSTHDFYTFNHSVNVAVYSIAICKRVHSDEKSALMTAGLGGILHDLGKRSIPLEIINKPGKLTAEEWEMMKQHPTYGLELVAGAKTIPEDAKRVISEHHENLDGTGYPRGLTDTQISKLAKIATIADVFDALTTKRAYKDPVPAEKALEIMASMAEGKFDKTVFRHFQKSRTKRSELTFDRSEDPCLPTFSIKKAG